MTSDIAPFDLPRYIGKYWTETLYPKLFKNGEGAFFNLVLEETEFPTVLYSPPFPSRNRLMFSITFIKAKNEIAEISIRKFKQFTSRGADRRPAAIARDAN